jgi:hypothetical protein
MAVPKTTVSPTGTDILYTRWRSIIQGDHQPGDEPYADILKKRVSLLSAWAQSQPNASQLKTLLGRVQEATAPNDRITRASGLLEISKSLDKNPAIRDLLVDQAQDDLNIAFDKIYVLNPNGMKDISGIFNAFVQGFDELNKQVFKPRSEPTKYYFIATTLTAQNTEKMKEIAVKGVKEIYDSEFVAIFERFAETDNTDELSKQLTELGEKYNKLLASSSVSVSDYVEIDKRIKECKQFAALIPILKMSPVAKEQFDEMRSNIIKAVKSRRSMNSNRTSIPMLFIYAISTILFFAGVVMLCLKTKKILFKN